MSASQKRVSTRRQGFSKTATENPPSAIPRRVTRSKALPLPTTRETRSMKSRARNSPASDAKFHHNNNKENLPLGPRPSLGARLLKGSPPRPSNKGIEKKPFGKSQKNARVPLRELSEHEIFMRDEAVIGDLRRRRVSGGNVDGPADAVEVDTVLAHPSPSNLLPHHSSYSSISSEETEESNDTGITVPDMETPLLQPQKMERIQVLRRSDSEERLKSKLEAIAASNASKSTAPRALRKRTALQTKKLHPAVRNSLGSPSAVDVSITESSIVHCVEASPVLLRPRRGAKGASPRSVTKEYAGITKVQASPSPLKAKRVGLGMKSANTAMVMKRVLGEANSNLIGKVVFNTSDKASSLVKSATTTTKKKIAVSTNTTTIGKGKSSLKRAAGVAAANSAKVGLAGIGRMR